MQGHSKAGPVLLLFHVYQEFWIEEPDGVRAVNGWATDEKSFSDRIWSNRTQMVNELQQLTVQIATGAAPDDAIVALEKYVDKDIRSAKAKAGTLVMTESAAIGNAAQMMPIRSWALRNMRLSRRWIP